MPQPEFTPAPDSITGEPGMSPPTRFHPSPELICASYQDSGPPNGPCGLIKSRVAPSAERVGATATARDVRHAETVAYDGRVVFGRGDQRRSGVEPAETGFVRPGKSEERQDGEHDQSNYAAQDHAAPASTARH